MLGLGSRMAFMEWGDIGKGWVVRGYNPLFRNE